MKVWRFTGNPENWLTAIEKEAWALNENNLNNWKNLQQGDVAIFHSTAKSDFVTGNKSAVIGFGYVGSGSYKKDDLWWIQEIQNQENIWPYVIPLKNIYTYSDVSKIDFNTPIDKKTPEQVTEEIITLLDNSIPLSTLNEKAAKEDSSVPQFPVNGSASGINPFYEELILKESPDLFIKGDSDGSEDLEKRLAEATDYYYEKLSVEEAKGKLVFKDSGEPQYKVTNKTMRVRKEDAKQKRLVARIENYTCQLCGYHYQYTNQSGKNAWIYEVDHIIEKSAGGNENPDNLWVLCPNCHSKKTKGVITIDLKNKEIKENGNLVELFQDNHLFGQRKQQ